MSLAAVPSLAAWSLKRLMAGLPLDGVDPTALPDPWPGVISTLGGLPVKDRPKALEQSLAALGHDVRAGLLQIAAIDPNSPAPAAPKPRYTLRWAAEALQTVPPMDWLVDGLAPATGVALLFGDPGAKKTWIALHLAVSVAMGADWLGRATKRGPALVLDEESGDLRMRRRLAAVMRGLNAPADLPLAYVSLAGFKPGDLGDLAEIDGILAQVQPALVVLDALADVLTGNENAVEDVMPLMQALRRLAEDHHCLVLVIHHANRANGSYRGSSAILGAVDLAVQVTSQPSSPNVDFEITKTRDGEPGTFAAAAAWTDLPEETFTLEEATPRAKRPHYSRSEEFVLRYLEEHGPSLLTDIVNHADTCSAGAARMAVYALARKQIVRRCDSGGPGAVATYALAADEDDPAEVATQTESTPPANL